MTTPSRPSIANQTTRAKWLVLGTLCLCLSWVLAAPSAPLAAQGPLAVDSGSTEVESSVSSRGGVVYSTYAGIAPSPAFATNTFLTTDLTGILGAEVSVLEADDFVVDGHGWRIDEVEVRGVYINFGGNSGPAAAVNVYFLPDGGGGFPATTDVLGGAIKAYPALSYTEIDDGDFRMVLVDGGGNPDPVILPPGTYWVSVQPLMALLSNGTWGWTESSAAPDTGVSIGAESVWMQDFALVNGTDGMPHCDQGSWGRRVTDCLITRAGDPSPLELDAAFRFFGEALTPGSQLSETTLQTSEAGVGATFEVVLTAPPNGAVTLPLGVAPASEGVVSPASLNFDAGNWNVPQTVTITPVDDAVPEADVNYMLSNGPMVSGDPGYDGLAVAAIQVTNLDDDSAGLTLSPLAGLTISEAGATDTLDIALDAPLGPGESLTLPLSISPAGVATIAASVVFTDADGTNPQSVVVTPIDDLVFDENSPFAVVTGDPTSNNPIFDALGATDVPDADGLRIENDVVGATVSVAGGSPLTTDESGATGTFTVVLTSEPLAPVTFDLATSDATEGTLSTSQLVFDAGNWNVDQVTTVTGQPDDFDDGDLNYTISILPAPGIGDPYYALFDPNDVAAINLDDDTAGFDITPLAVEVDETGVEALIAIHLTAEPTFDLEPVRLPLTVSDPTEAEISWNGEPFSDTSEIQWTQSQWQDDMILTVRGVDDLLLDGDVPFLIETGDVTGGDLPYANLEPQDVLDIDGINRDDERVVEVPTVDELGLLALLLLLATSGLLALRRD